MEEDAGFAPSSQVFYVRVVSSTISGVSFVYQLSATTRQGAAAIEPLEAEISFQKERKERIEAVCQPGESHTYRITAPHTADTVVTVDLLTRYVTAD